MAAVLCISNEKGGTGKSSAAVSLGIESPETLPVTLATVMGRILTET